MEDLPPFQNGCALRFSDLETRVFQRYHLAAIEHVGIRGKSILRVACRQLKNPGIKFYAFPLFKDSL